MSIARTTATALTSTVKQSRRQRVLLASVLAVPAIAAFSTTAHAANQYWDINGTNTGATDDGGGVASGTWDNSTALFATESTGTSASTAWVSANTPFFSAGTNATGASAITVVGAKTVAGMNLEDGTLTFSGDQINLSTATLATANNTTIGNVIGGTAGLTKSSTGSLTLTGNNIYTGTTTLSAGTLTLTGSNTLTGATTVTTGTLNLDYTTNNTNKINPAGLLTLGNGAAVNVLGVNGVSTDTLQTVSGTTLSANGNSTITVTAGDTQNATLGLGTVTRGAAAVLNLKTATAGGTASFTTTSTGTNGILGGYATLNGSDFVGIAGGAIVVPTYDTDDFSASTKNTDVTTDASPAGPTAVNSLRFNTGASTVTLTGAGNTITTGGILVTANAGGGSLTGGSLTSGTTDVVVTQNSASEFTLGSALTGAIGLTKAGPGTLVLSGANANTGPYTVYAGTLKLGASEVINNTSIVAVSAGATLDLNGNAETVGSLSGAGAVNLSADLTTGGNTAAATLSGILSGGGNLTKNGTGTQTLSGANTYTGNTTINAGVLAISTAAALGTNAGGTTVNTGAALQITGAVNIPEPLTISGTGIANAGAIRKTAANNTTLTGGITLQADSRINSDANTLFFNTADVNNNGFNLTLGGAGNESFTAKITGAGQLIKDGTGNVTFANNNSNYTGKTVINAGSLTYNFQAGSGVGPGGPSPTSGPVADFFTLNGGTLVNASTGNAGTALEPNKGITLGANGGTYSMTDPTVTFVHIYRGPISGPGGFTKAGVGTLAITGVFGQFNGVETYAGSTTVAAGILRLRQEGTTPNFVTGALPATTDLILNTGGTFDMAGFNQTVNTVSGAGALVGNASGGVLTIAGNNAVAATYSGNLTSTTQIATTLKLTKNGTGTQIFSGTNLNTGVITVNGGILQFATAAALGGTGANMTVAAAGTAAAGYAMDQAFLGRIVTTSTGVAALAADSANNLDLSTLPTLRLGAVGSATYSGTLTTGSTYLLGGGGGTLKLANAITDGKNLDVGTSGTVVLSGTNRVGTLAVSGAKLDVVNNALVLTATAQSALRGLLQTGRAANGSDVGQWTGNGLASSTAAADADKITGIGYLTAGDKGVTTWNGVTGLSSTDVITLVTKYGDINLDGKVDTDDLALLDRGNAQYITGVVAANSAVWLNGDFNYDGIVDSKDYFLADKSYGKATGQLSAGFLASREAQFGDAYVSSLIAAVPEPTSLAACGLAVSALLPRRRRNAR